jgi:hypothetical protein
MKPRIDEELLWFTDGMLRRRRPGEFGWQRRERRGMYGEDSSCVENSCLN